MNTVEYWQWWIDDPLTGARRRTVYRVTAETALQRYLQPVRVAGSLEVRLLRTAADRHRSARPVADRPAFGA